MEIPLPVALAVLGAALLHATWNALVKSGTDKQLDVVANSAWGGTLALAAALALPAPARESWPWIAASAIVHIVYFWALAAAYRWGDMSFSYPIMRGGGPLIVTVAGVLVFGERLPWAETLGVALICAGIFAFAAHSAADPAAQRKSLAFALLNACVIATYTLIDAQGARLSGAPVSYTLWLCVANGGLNLGLACMTRGAVAPTYLAQRWRRGLIGGACSIAAYSIALWAMTQAPVALVAVLRETSVVFAAAIGALFLKERFTLRKVAATGAVLAGLLAMRL